MHMHAIDGEIKGSKGSLSNDLLEYICKIVDTEHKAW